MALDPGLALDGELRLSQREAFLEGSKGKSTSQARSPINFEKHLVDKAKQPVCPHGGVMPPSHVPLSLCVAKTMTNPTTD